MIVFETGSNELSCFEWLGGSVDQLTCIQFLKEMQLMTVHRLKLSYGIKLRSTVIICIGSILPILSTYTSLFTSL